jgi:hypothetical protein
MGLLVTIAVVGWRTRIRDLSALAIMGIVVSVTIVVSFSAFPKDNLGPAGYLANVLWVVGILVWVTVLWAGGELGLRVLRSQVTERERRPVDPVVRWVAPLAAFAVLAVITFAGIRVSVPASSSQVAHEQVDVPLDRAIASAVERRAPPGPVVVTADPSVFPSPAVPFGSYAVDYWGTAMVLLGDGWTPALADRFSGAATNLSVPNHARWPEFVVLINPVSLRLMGVRLFRL